jgi:hypothetical protein
MQVSIRMRRPPISISHECTLSLIHPVAGSKWFGTIQGRCSATISSRQSLKNVFASKFGS